MKGRKPTPTKLKLLRGEKHKERINQGEPKPKAANLRCPNHLNKEAKKYWKEEAPKLYRLGLLTEINRGPFELLCEAYGDWKIYKAMINEGKCPECGCGGIAIKTPNGSLQLSPLASMLNRAHDQYRRLCVEFGLTPSSISRISLTGKGKKSDFGDMID